MEGSIIILKKEIGQSDLELIRSLIERYGHRGRTFISKVRYVYSLKFALTKKVP